MRGRMGTLEVHGSRLRQRETEDQMSNRKELEEIAQKLDDLKRDRIAKRLNGVRVRLCQFCRKEVLRPDPDPRTPYIRPRIPNICPECRESFRDGRKARRKAKYEAERKHLEENDPVWEDPWRVKLEEFLADKVKIEAKRCWAVVEVRPEKRTQSDCHRLFRVMRSLRWKSKKIWNGTGTVKGYVPE